MAWLETKGDVYRIRFRFGGAKHLCALSTSDETEAKDALSRFALEGVCAASSSRRVTWAMMPRSGRGRATRP